MGALTSLGTCIEIVHACGRPCRFELNAVFLLPGVVRYRGTACVVWNTFEWHFAHHTCTYQCRNSMKLCTSELWWFKPYFVLISHGECTPANARRPFLCRHTFGCTLLTRSFKSAASRHTSNNVAKLPRAFKPQCVADRRKTGSYASRRPHCFCSVQSAHRKPGDGFTTSSASNGEKRNTMLKQGLLHVFVGICRGECTSASKLLLAQYKRIPAGCSVVPGFRVLSRAAGPPEPSNALSEEVCPENAKNASTLLLPSKHRCGVGLHSTSTREHEKLRCRYKPSGEATWRAWSLIATKGLLPSFRLFGEGQMLLSFSVARYFEP